MYGMLRLRNNQLCNKNQTADRIPSDLSNCLIFYLGSPSGLCLHSGCLFSYPSCRVKLFPYSPYRRIRLEPKGKESLSCVTESSLSPSCKVMKEVPKHSPHSKREIIPKPDQTTDETVHRLPIKYNTVKDCLIVSKDAPLTTKKRVSRFKRAYFNCLLSPAC